MDVRIMNFTGVALSALLVAGAPALALAQSSSTTVIEEHKVVPPVETAPPPPPAMVMHRSTTTVSASSASRSGPMRPAPRHRVVRHRHPMARTVVHHDTAVVDQQAAPPPPAQPSSPATVDRRTVIHRDSDGGVVRHTKVVKQDADGNRTSVERRTVTEPNDAPPPPPPSNPN
jgi:hypothetical protein